MSLKYIQRNLSHPKHFEIFGCSQCDRLITCASNTSGWTHNISKKSVASEVLWNIFEAKDWLRASSQCQPHLDFETGLTCLPDILTAVTAFFSWCWWHFSWWCWMVFLLLVIMIMISFCSSVKTMMVKIYQWKICMWGNMYFCWLQRKDISDANQNCKDIECGWKGKDKD